MVSWYLVQKTTEKYKKQEADKEEKLYFLGASEAVVPGSPEDLAEISACFPAEKSTPERTQIAFLP